MFVYLSTICLNYFCAKKNGGFYEYFALNNEPWDPAKISLNGLEMHESKIYPL
jgi:hypothetical protein